jgi:PKD repeat protein
MPLPKANFYFENKELLKIGFKDLSNQSSTPPVTSWLWNFGDGTDPNNKTQQSPEHTYSVPGIYLVSLTVANSEGQSIRSIYIELDGSKFIVSIPIVELVKLKIPAALFDYLNVTTSIQKWQLYLQPQLNPENLVVSNADVFNETKWPSLYNVLIAELVVYDVLMDAINMMAAMAANTIPTVPTGGGGSSTTNVNNPNGNIKIVEVGPSKTEWFNQTESASQYFKAVLGSGGKKSGFIMELQEKICTIAKRLQVVLPFCDQDFRLIQSVKSGRSGTPSFETQPLYPNLEPYGTFIKR